MSSPAHPATKDALIDGRWYNYHPAVRGSAEGENDSSSFEQALALPFTIYPFRHISVPIPQAVLRKRR
jgi:hypothetical protein